MNREPFNPGHPPHGWDWPDERMKAAHGWFLRFTVTLLACATVLIASDKSELCSLLRPATDVLAIVCLAGLPCSAGVYLVRKEQLRQQKRTHGDQSAIKRVR